jgi:hypothetical protein
MNVHTDRNSACVTRDGGSNAAQAAGGRSQSAFSLHIERLVIDGVPFTSAQGAQFQKALERELARLVKGCCHARRWRDLGAVAVLAAPAIHAPVSARPTDLGRQVARSVFASLQPNA